MTNYCIAKKFTIKSEVELIVKLFFRKRYLIAIQVFFVEPLNLSFMISSENY